MTRRAVLLCVWFVLLSVAARAAEPAPPPPDPAPPQAVSPGTAGLQQAPQLGIGVTSAGRPEARALGVESPTGAVILHTVPGAPAENAGLRRGDLIVEFAGREIQNREDLESAARRSPIGSRQRVVFVRGNQRRTVEMLIGTRPAPEPVWYSHAEGRYRVRVFEGWKILRPDQPAVPPERRFDKIESTDGGYTVLCFHASWDAPQPELALRGFTEEKLRERPGASPGRFHVGGAPAAWVAYAAGTERRVMVYRMSFVHGGRRFVVNAEAPVLSDPEQLPAPLADVLQAIVFVPGSPGAKPPVPPTGEPVAPPAVPAPQQVVRPADQPQTIRSPGGIEVTIPGGVLKDQQLLAIRAVPESQMPREAKREFKSLGRYEVSLGPMREFQKELELTLPYDPAALNPAYSPAEQIAAFRWDAPSGTWVLLPTRVDEERKTATALTKHLTLFEWVCIGVGVVAIDRTTAGIEWAANDIFRSPRCKVLYNGKAIRASTAVNDTAWKAAGGGNEPNVKWVKVGWMSDQTNDGYQPGVPLYVQDLAHAVDTAYDAYAKGSAGFRMPPAPVMVKIDSLYYQLFSNADGMYNKLFYKRIHVGSATLTTPVRVRQITAHELFHAVQHRYFYATEMVSSYYTWWLDAMSEYAACRIPWTLTTMGGQGRTGVYPRLFERPLSATGEVPRFGDLEYDKAFLVEYLVRQGAPFRDMHDAVVAYARSWNRSEPERLVTEPLSQTLRKATGQGLEDHVRGFVRDFLFTTRSPIAGVDPATGCTESNAFETFALPAPSGTAPAPLTHRFTLAPEYTAKVWAVQPETDPSRPNATRGLLVELVSQSPAVHVEVFLLRENRRVPGPAKPDRYLTKPDEPCLLHARAGDMLYVVAFNLDRAAEGQAEVRLRDATVRLQIDPATIAENSGVREFKFTATAKGIPATVTRVSYQWDFADKSPSNLELFKEPVAETISFSRLHHFPDEGRYTVSLRLFDTTLAAPVLLATAVAEVRLASAASLALDPPITVAEPRVPVPFEVKAVKAPQRAVFVWDFGDKSAPVTTGAGQATHAFDREGEYRVAVKVFDAADRKTPLAATGGFALIETSSQETGQLAILHKCNHIHITVHVPKSKREYQSTNGKHHLSQESVGVGVDLEPVQWTGRAFRVRGTDTTRPTWPEVTITGFFDESIGTLRNLTFTSHGESWRKEVLRIRPGEERVLKLGSVRDENFNLHEVRVIRSQPTWVRCAVGGKEARDHVTGLDVRATVVDFGEGGTTRTDTIRWHSFDWDDAAAQVTVVFRPGG